MTKGHRGGRHKLYKQANESLIKALSHAYRHRKERKGDFRRLWITRINAAARENGLSYSQFIYGLHQSGVEVDRKILADIAVRDSETFAQLASAAKGRPTGCGRGLALPKKSATRSTYSKGRVL